MCPDSVMAVQSGEGLTMIERSTGGKKTEGRERWHDNVTAERQAEAGL